jgi:hypothetical protein
MAEESNNLNIKPASSSLFKISIRAWIAMLLTFTLCLSIISKFEVPGYFITLVSMVISFYFGNAALQSSSKSS